MKRISKENLDRLIKIHKKYYKTGDTDYLSALFEKEKELFGPDGCHWIDDIMTGITTKTHDYNTPNELYYKVLEVLGFEIIEGEQR